MGRDRLHLEFKLVKSPERMMTRLSFSVWLKTFPELSKHGLTVVESGQSDGAGNLEFSPPLFARIPEIERGWPTQETADDQAGRGQSRGHQRGGGHQAHKAWCEVGGDWSSLGFHNVLGRLDGGIEHFENPS